MGQESHSAQPLKNKKLLFINCLLFLAHFFLAQMPFRGVCAIDKPPEANVN